MVLSFVRICDGGAQCDAVAHAPSWQRLVQELRDLEGIPYELPQHVTSTTSQRGGSDSANPSEDVNTFRFLLKHNRSVV